MATGLGPAKVNWPAVRAAMVERRDELRGWAGLLELDMSSRSGPPRRAEPERLTALQANVAQLEEWLGLLERALPREGG